MEQPILKALQINFYPADEIAKVFQCIPNLVLTQYLRMLLVLGDMKSMNYSVFSAHCRGFLLRRSKQIDSNVSSSFIDGMNIVVLQIQASKG